MVSAKWKKLFCVIETVEETSSKLSTSGNDKISTTRLAGYARARDSIEGTAPDRIWNLDSFEVRSLASSDATSRARTLLQGAPFGFELEVHSGCSQFTCCSLMEMDTWMRALRNTNDDQSSCASSLCSDQADIVNNSSLFGLFDFVDQEEKPQHDSAASAEVASEAATVGLAAKVTSDAAAEAVATKPKDIEKTEEATSAGNDDSDGKHTSMPTSGLVSRVRFEDCGNETQTAAAEEQDVEEETEVDALSQLRRFDKETTLAEERWRSAMAETALACRNIFRFFGLDPPNDAKTNQALSQLLKSLTDFLGQVNKAWEDIEKHGCIDAKKVRKRPRRLGSADTKSNGPPTGRNAGKGRGKSKGAGKGKGKRNGTNSVVDEAETVKNEEPPETSVEAVHEGATETVKDEEPPETSVEAVHEGATETVKDEEPPETSVEAVHEGVKE
eukprot:TRINITY_DN1832_c0_g1_i1.p1 TRINITY_DN1832_c0_g1~~TRINITY_DN1832_c0_g1_i1.p1  ORF type:complete len:444 (-),score=103.27 TRINITY_DN1832_c0_g1_i1:238-1569(-)